MTDGAAPDELSEPVTSGASDRVFGLVSVDDAALHNEMALLGGFPSFGGGHSNNHGNHGEGAAVRAFPFSIPLSRLQIKPGRDSDLADAEIGEQVAGLGGA